MKNYSVYIHTNLINNKKYIGITSQRPERRWRNGDGYEKNKQPVFYNAIKKYGWDNFSHEVVFQNLSLEEAIKKEMALIEEYNTYVHSKNSQGYNLTRGGEGNIKVDIDLINELWDEGYPVTTISNIVKCNRDTVRRNLACNTNYTPEESRKRSSLLNKGKGNKAINQFAIDGTFIKTYDSVTHAAEAVNGQQSNITTACDNPKKSAYGFLWRSVNSNIPTNNFHFKNSKTIEQYDKEGKLIKSYPSIKEASLETKIGASNISRAANGARKTAGGYIWKIGVD